MKKHILLVCLLAITILVFGAIKYDKANKAVKFTSKNELLSYSCYKEKPISELRQDMENRSGRQLTYFWAEHSDKPVKAQIKNI